MMGWVPWCGASVKGAQRESFESVLYETGFQDVISLDGSHTDGGAIREAFLITEDAAEASRGEVRTPFHQSRVDLITSHV